MSEQDIWGKDWMEIQRKYWEGWTDLTRQSMGVESPPSNPWETAMRQWWNTVAPSAPSPAQDFTKKLMDQGMGFFRMAEQFAQGLGKTPDMGDWNKLGQQWFNGLQQTFSSATKSTEDTMNRVMAFWEMPLDNWQRMASTLSLVPGDVLRNMPHGNRLDQFLSAPGLGYTREEQAQYQKLAQLALDYQRALQDYALFFSGLGVKAADRMRQVLSERQAQDRPVESARELYDLWIEACETTYNEQVMTDEYSVLHGKLVNALMAYKAHTSQMIDGVLGALDMPTQRELRTVHERLQRTRRDSSRMRKELVNLQCRLDELSAGGSKDDEMTALREELASMQGRLEELSTRAAAEASRSPQAKAAPKKSASRKKAVRKTAGKSSGGSGNSGSAKRGDTAGTA